MVTYCFVVHVLNIGLPLCASEWMFRASLNSTRSTLTVTGKKEKQLFRLGNSDKRENACIHRNFTLLLVMHVLCKCKDFSK